MDDDELRRRALLAPRAAMMRRGTLADDPEDDELDQTLTYQWIALQLAWIEFRDYCWALVRQWTLPVLRRLERLLGGRDDS